MAIIESLNNGKAAGLDQLFAKILKRGVEYKSGKAELGFEYICRD